MFLQLLPGKHRPRQGKRLDEYVNIVQVKPWQGQIDAVVAKKVRATMVAEDVWKTICRFVTQLAHFFGSTSTKEGALPALVVIFAWRIIVKIRASKAERHHRNLGDTLRCGSWCNPGLSFHAPSALRFARWAIARRHHRLMRDGTLCTRSEIIKPTTLKTIGPNNQQQDPS